MKPGQVEALRKRLPETRKLVQLLRKQGKKRKRALELGLLDARDELLAVQHAKREFALLLAT